MKLDQKRLDRQRKCFQAWLDNSSSGIIEAVTGFGKTFIAVLAIQSMNQRHPDFGTIVVVPTTKLKSDWTGEWVVNEETGVKEWIPGHIEKFSLIDVRVFVVNTYVKYAKWKCDLLILDEIHHYASYDSKYFSTVLAITQRQFTLGLSATLEDNEKAFLLKEGKLKIVDIVDEIEAEREGYISSSITYNLAIPLSPQDDKFNTDINDKFRYYFSKFDHEFDLVKACNCAPSISMGVRLRGGNWLGRKTSSEWRKYIAQKKGWNGDSAHPYSPDNISKYAAQAMRIIRIRKERWHNLPSKVGYVEKLVANVPNKKVLVFSESAEMADKITAKLGDKCRSYHTKLKSIATHPTDGDTVVIEGKGEGVELRKLGYKVKGKGSLLKENIAAFQKKDSGVDVLSAVRAVDEGVDIQSIEVLIMVAYHSTKRQNTQREGRGKRIDYDNLTKKTLIINLYVKGTQEEKWLKKKQKGKRMVRWVDKITEVVLNPTISLGKPLNNVNSNELLSKTAVRNGCDTLEID